MKLYLSCLLRLYYLYIDNTGVFIIHNISIIQNEYFPLFLNEIELYYHKNRVRIKIVSL